MAKPFYSMDEVCRMLGRDQEGVKALVREGKLREFRDAGKIFFKADDVDKIAGRSPTPKEDTGEIRLDAGDDELPSLSEVAGTGTGTSMIGLAPIEEDDTAKRKKEGTVISASGIGVFDDDELEIETDPMAKTTISAAATDQVSLEGTGSGSGLLDLTRESDDTSLGAELLDEIYPGEEEAAAKPAKPAKQVVKKTTVVQEVAEEEPAYVTTEVTEVVAPVSIVAGGDPYEGAMSGLMVGATIALVVAGSVVAGVLQGFMPDYARFLSNNFWYFLAGTAVVVVIAMFVGALLGKASTPRRV